MKIRLQWFGKTTGFRILLPGDINNAIKGCPIFMIVQSFREVVKRFRSNHKYLVTGARHGGRPGYRLAVKP